jgi:type I restriction enzyme S subunit
VFSYEATLNRYAMIPKGFRGCLGRRMALIRPDESKACGRYLYYYFFGKEWRNVIAQNTLIGSTVDRIPIAKFPDFPITAPPLPTQRKIAAILSGYDDLIENNLRRIKILEEMARNLYREWFVKFRFPGHQQARFTDSPLGRIPEGWEVKRLGKLADQIRDGVNPDSVAPETPYFGLEHLPRKSISLAEWGFASEVKSTKLLFKNGDILFGKIRPYFHKVGVAPLPGVCSSDTIVIRPRVADWFGLVLGCTSSAEFVEHATATSQGTKMPRANWDVLVKYQIPLPPQPILGQFNEFMNGIVSQLHNFVFRNQNLRRTRDLLLPRLISGEMDVSELDIITPEEAEA